MTVMSVLVSASGSRDADVDRDSEDPDSAPFYYRRHRYMWSDGGCVFLVHC